MTRRLGDQPIEPHLIETMRVMARALDEFLNGDVKGKIGDRQVGFALLVFPFGEREGRCNHISNGAGRADVVMLMRGQIRRFEGQPDITGAA